MRKESFVLATSRDSEVLRIFWFACSEREREYYFMSTFFEVPSSYLERRLEKTLRALDLVMPNANLR